MLTRSPNLAEKLRTYSARLLSTLSQKLTVPFNADKQASWSLFDLDPASFPLVCTYEQFLMLVGNGIEYLHPAASQTATKRHSDMNIVDFKAFKSRFWPHFPQHLTKGLSPDLVFSDIMGVIKGSVYTCKNLSFLSLNQYEDLSVRVTPNVTSGEDRRRVFRMYEIYEELKRKTDQLDTIDYVLDLLRPLRMDPNLVTLLASCIQEIYVDEVQDQRCLDISLLLTLVHNPLGVHFGGDTAQAISQDSVFRFQDVKALFHDHFSLQSVSVDQQHLAQPHIFTLSRNYRSHQGILSVASSVMGLLWKTFPDTVDKLEPEIGTMIGPAPILFQKCDSSILMHHSKEASTAPQHELLFGAEQVVIARDDISKADLAKQVGETVLILTILQAKGMEFDDVILWNFFTATPDAVGWRSLCDFIDGKLSFYDTAKHAVLCSELKHLYVAITRARVRVLFVEMSGDAAQPFVKLVNKDSALALIEVTSAGSSDFEEKMKSLQPRKSGDPHRWLANGADMMARCLYADAALCFRRGQSPLKEKEAKAHLQQEQGEELKAKGDTLGSQAAFLGAAAVFKELGLISEASSLLIRGDRLEEAAELWYTHNNFERAATLFESLPNYRRAFESWHAGGYYNKAIIALRQGQFFDKMIKFLAEHQQSLNDRDKNQHKHAVKLLLKKQRLSADIQTLAITLVGTYAEQESFYIEYGMMANLLDLYRQQQATMKLFNLLLELGDLEEAWKVFPSLDPDTERYPDKSLLSNIEALIWVNRIYVKSGSAHIPPCAASHSEIDSWESASKLLHGDWDHSSSQSRILSMDDASIIKTFLCLYITVNLHVTASETTRPGWISLKTPPSKDQTNQRVVSDHQSIGTGNEQDSRKRLVVSDFNDIPFEILLHTIKLVKTRPLESRSILRQAMLLLCGVFQNFDSQRKYTTRGWSPPEVTAKPQSLPEAAMSWTLDNITDAITRAHEAIRSLFKTKWRTQCSIFVVTGRCNVNDHNHRLTNHHTHISSAMYTSKLEDLLRINTMACELTPLYYRRLMPERVSKLFLGFRRHWVEKLITEFAFISAFQQDSRVLMGVATRLKQDKSLAAVTTAMEDNLLYKARNEWESRANLGYILEQFNCVTHLGYQVKERLVRRTEVQFRHSKPSTHASMALSAAIHASHRQGDPIHFYDALRKYTSQLLTLEMQHFGVFHCHTGMFEEIALFLLLQMSQSSILVPQSWLDLHLAGILKRYRFEAPFTWEQRCTCRDSLVLLLTTFIKLLQWLNEPLQANADFDTGGRSYPRRILQQRNAELLAVIIINLRANPSLWTQGLVPIWEDVIKVFQLPTVRATHLVHAVNNGTDLTAKLLLSHSRYLDKNPMIILSITTVQRHPFTDLQKSHKLRGETIRALRDHFASIVPSESSTNPDADQIAAEEKAVLCIQRHWRRYGPQLQARNKARNAFVKTALGRTVANFQAISKGSGLRIRFSLIHYGVDCFLQLDDLIGRVSDLRKRTLDWLENASFDQSGAHEDLLKAAGELGEDMKAHRERVNDEVLKGLARGHDEEGIKELFKSEMTQMAGEEAKLEELCHMLDGMS